MSARDAVTTAEQYVDMLTGKERLVGQAFPGVYEAIRDAHIAAALDADARPLDENPAYTAALSWLRTHATDGRDDDVRFTAQEAAQRRLWQLHRVVYDIDRSLWSELGDTDTDAVIPADVFTRLPHPNPFILLPEPLVLDLDDGNRQRIQGFFVRGHIDIPGQPGQRLQASTNHPDVTALGVTFGGLIETPTGQPLYVSPGVRDVLWTRVTLDPRTPHHTVAEMIDYTVSRFTGYRDSAYRADVPLMIRRAVSLLVYLCATNADLTPLPRQTSAGTGKAKTGKGKGARHKPSTIIGVGYRIGHALAAYRRQEHQEAEEARKTGRHTAPHIRRAHFHTFRVGPGRQESVVKWLSPIPVNMHGPDDPTTVIPVHPRPVTNR